MRTIPERSIRFTKDLAYSVVADGCESRPPRPAATPPCKKAGSVKETRNRQQLMRNLIAPFMETCRVSTQKSADGIVVVGAGSPCPYDEGLNAEKRMTLS